MVLKLNNPVKLINSDDRDFNVECPKCNRILKIPLTSCGYQTNELIKLVNTLECRCGYEFSTIDKELIGGVEEGKKNIKSDSLAIKEYKERKALQKIEENMENLAKDKERESYKKQMSLDQISIDKYNDTEEVSNDEERARINSIEEYKRHRDTNQSKSEAIGCFLLLFILVAIIFSISSCSSSYDKKIKNSDPMDLNMDGVVTNKEAADFKKSFEKWEQRQEDNKPVGQ